MLPDMPVPKGNSVKVLIYFGTDHTHDLETRVSIAGYLCYVKTLLFVSIARDKIQLRLLLIV